MELTTLIAAVAAFGLPCSNPELRETFLRANLDQAIVALTGDGTIENILKSFGFPAAPVR